MTSLARIVNLFISSVVTLLAYPREVAIDQVAALLQKIAQLAPSYAFILEGVILLANFMLTFLLLSVLLEVFESKD